MKVSTVLFLIYGLVPFSDGSITWYEPPPIQTVPDVTNPVVTHKPNTTKLREGSINASLSWNFSLSSDVSFSSLTIFFNSGAIAAARSNGIYGVIPGSGFEEKFGFRWISSQRATLIIFNLTTAETDGLYSCQVFADKGLLSISWRSEVRVDVVSPAKITFISPNQTKNESDAVTLICNATGKPQPTIRWTRNLPDESNVTFNITGEQDKGVYTCTADNGVGNPDRKDVHITVDNFHPVDTNLSTSLNGMTVVVNTSFNLICSARASPPAKYRLYRGQKSLLNTTVGQSSVLYTTNVTERISQVNYSCTPFNFYGDGPTQTVTVTVTVHFSPNITDISRDKTVNEGATVTLSCTADGNPTPTITWRRPNNTVVNWTNTLTLTGISRQENGTYRCTANNGVGSRVTKDVLITVHCECLVMNSALNIYSKLGVKSGLK